MRTLRRNPPALGVAKRAKPCSLCLETLETPRRPGCAACAETVSRILSETPETPAAEREFSRVAGPYRTSNPDGLAGQQQRQFWIQNPKFADVGSAGGSWLDSKSDQVVQQQRPSVLSFERTHSDKRRQLDQGAGSGLSAREGGNDSLCPSAREVGATPAPFCSWRPNFQTNFRGRPRQQLGKGVAFCYPLRAVPSSIRGVVKRHLLRGGVAFRYPIGSSSSTLRNFRRAPQPAACEHGSVLSHRPAARPAGRPFLCFTCQLFRQLFGQPPAV